MALDSISIFELSRLLIAGLPLSITEGQLLQECRLYGELQSIRIKRAKKQASASVLFTHSDYAKAARQCLNGRILFGSRVSACLPGALLEKSLCSNIFVKNIPFQADCLTLESLFKSFGEIINSKIAYDDFGASRGYGLVMFRTKEQAERVLSSDKSFEIHGHPLILKAFVPKPLRVPRINNLYVRGFSENYSSTELISEFSQFGQVDSALVVNKPYGNFGFVCFADPENADKAISALHGKTSNQGFEWYLSRNLSRSERSIKLKMKNKRSEEKWSRQSLYVKNWPVELNETQLANVFEKFGKIESVKMLTQECLTVVYDQPFTEVKPTGQAFVCYKEEKAVDIALNCVKHMRVNNVMLKVFRWVPKSVLNIKSWKKKETTIGQKISRISEPVGFFDLHRYKNADSHEKKRVFGEAVYQEINQKYGNFTGKITGMIIELDEGELLQMMGNKHLLYEKAKEAMKILRPHVLENDIRFV